jgi:hypothetical protein
LIEWVLSERVINAETAMVAALGGLSTSLALRPLLVVSGVNYLFPHCSYLGVNVFLA